MTSLTFLSDNRVSRAELLAEHGLSILVETDEGAVLFDTGQTGVVEHNARHLAKDDAPVDAIVLSHGHYDHTGGVMKALDLYPDGKVFAHPNAFRERYSGSSAGGTHAAGMPWTKKELEERAEVTLTAEPHEIIPGVFTTGQIPRDAAEQPRGPFYLDESATESDPLEDEQALAIDTKRGLVVLTGCSHAGVPNILEYTKSLFPGHTIHALIGGMHLAAAGPEQLDQVVKSLKEMDTTIVLPGHCSGWRATTHLMNELSCSVAPLSVGMHMRF